jgi:hypothetical protein
VADGIGQAGPPAGAGAPRIIPVTRFENPYEAYECRATCLLCDQQITVRFPRGVTATRRREMISEALDPHRALCPGGPPEVQRRYRLEYPRR